MKFSGGGNSFVVFAKEFKGKSKIKNDMKSDFDNWFILSFLLPNDQHKLRAYAWQFNVLDV